MGRRQRGAPSRQTKVCYFRAAALEQLKGTDEEAEQEGIAREMLLTWSYALSEGRPEEGDVGPSLEQLEDGRWLATLQGSVNPGHHDLETMEPKWRDYHEEGVGDTILDAMVDLYDAIKGDL